MRDTELQRIEQVNKHCEEMLTNARLKEQQAQRLLDSAMLQHQAAQGPPATGDQAAVNTLAPVGQQLVGSLRTLFGRGRTVSGRSSQGEEHTPAQQGMLDAMLAPLATGCMAGATPPTRVSKTVAGHAGGCFGIAFDRCEGWSTASDSL